MDCIDRKLLDMLIKSAILDFIKDGKLQDIICCPTTPGPGGPDNDTKNRSMAWAVEPQTVSVTDTAGGVVSTVINFRKAEQLDANNVATPAAKFYGTASDVVLGEPNHWVRMVLSDGTVVQLPAYVQVNAPAPPPTTVSLCYFIDDGGSMSSQVSVYSTFKVGGTASDHKPFDASFPCREGADAAADATNVINSARTNGPDVNFIRTNLGWIKLEANGDITLRHYHFRKEADGTYTAIPLGGGYKLTQDGWLEDVAPPVNDIVIHFADGSRENAKFYPHNNVLDPGGSAFGAGYTPGFDHQGRISFFKQLKEVVGEKSIGKPTEVSRVETPYGIFLGDNWLGAGEPITEVYHPDDVDKVISGDLASARVVLRWRKWDFSSEIINDDYKGWTESEIDTDPSLWIN